VYPPRGGGGKASSAVDGGGDGGNCGPVDDHRERRGTAPAATSRGARLDVFVCPTRATPKGRKGTTTRFIRVKKDSMPHE
jgi:hypothetical protein